ncbi:MAG: FAD-binding protein [Rhodospirillales bacterium]|nr:FAD-binding protein [Rhodospirillales bacterium]
MSKTYKPDTPEQVLEAVKWALAEEQTLDIFGHATKRDFGRPSALGDNAVHGLDLAALSGINLYEPGELVMSAAAATPMSTIQAALDEQNQRLAFEPPNLGPLLGSGQNGGTIGGVFACNLAGPRRISAGSARDHILGFHAVSGRGEIFKSGGRVVKNVTGFDLSKLLAGSFGTLAVMTDVTFKILPTPEKSRTVLVMTPDSTSGVAAMTEALQSSFEVSAAAHLPAEIAALSDVSYVNGAHGALSALRIEGPGPSVEYRTRALRQLLAGYGETEELHTANTTTLWREIRDIGYFISGSEQIWRLSVPPADGARVAAKIIDNIGGRAFFDWGGGLIWLAMEARADAAHQDIRDAVKVSGGHATLIRAASDVRSQVPVFQPQPQALAELALRVKNSFDPKGVLCPGRMG